MAITITTYRDIIDHLLDVSAGVGGDRRLSIFKRAVRSAYRELVDQKSWRYFQREWQINLNSQTSGGTGKTLVYDHTGGANERLLTMAGETFPAWVSANPGHGRVKIGDDVYAIEDYLTTTTVTLRDTLNPGADVASTTDWTLYRNTYPFADDFNGMDELHNRDNLWAHNYVSPNDWAMYERYYGNLGEPFFWTIMKSQDATTGNDSRWVLRIAGYPTDTDKLFFIYRSNGSRILLSGLESKASSTSNTVAITTANKTATGTGTSWDSTMVDSYLRVSASTDLPTGEEGANPYAEQHKIRSVASTTSLTLWTTPSQILSGKAWVISDELDMEQSMINALLRGSEHQMHLLLNSEQKAGVSYEHYRRALTLAMEQDSKLEMLRQSGGGGRTWQVVFGDVDSYTFS